MKGAMKAPFEGLAAGRRAELEDDATSGFDIGCLREPPGIVVCNAMRNDVVIVKRQRASRFHMHGPWHKRVVPHDGPGIGPAAAIESQACPKDPIAPLSCLEGARRTSEGILWGRLVGSIGAVCDIFPLAVAIGPILGAETLLLTHHEESGGRSGILLKAPVGVEDRIALRVLKRAPGFHDQNRTVGI